MPSAGAPAGGVTVKFTVTRRSHGSWETSDTSEIVYPPLFGSAACATAAQPINAMLKNFFM